MDFTQIAMPSRLAIREFSIHACLHYHFQSFVVDA